MLFHVADYRWICVTSLKVNETDFEWESIKNHILGVWNSSDVSLDLGKLHNQIQALENSQFDFTATGEAKDFFYTFSNFISGKTILSTVYNLAPRNHTSLYCLDSSAEHS